MTATKKIQKNKGKKGFNFRDMHDLSSPKNQDMVFGMLGKYKKVVIPVLFFVVLLIVDIILTFLMAFGLL